MNIKLLEKAVLLRAAGNSLDLEPPLLDGALVFARLNVAWPSRSHSEVGN